MICSSVDVIVQAARLRDGSRRITHITEVMGMEGDAIITQDIMRLQDHRRGRQRQADRPAHVDRHRPPDASGSARATTARSERLADGPRQHGGRRRCRHGLTRPGACDGSEQTRHRRPGRDRRGRRRLCVALSLPGAVAPGAAAPEDARGHRPAQQRHAIRRGHVAPRDARRSRTTSRKSRPARKRSTS